MLDIDTFRNDFYKNKKNAIISQSAQQEILEEKEVSQPSITFYLIICSKLVRNILTKVIGLTTQIV